MRSVPIIAEILLLFTMKPVPNGGAYLAGFIISPVRSTTTRTEPPSAAPSLLP